MRLSSAGLLQAVQPCRTLVKKGLQLCLLLCNECQVTF